MNSVQALTTYIFMIHFVLSFSLVCLGAPNGLIPSGPRIKIL
jgi:hypothetical protein